MENKSVRMTDWALKVFPFLPEALKWRFGNGLLQKVRSVGKALSPRAVQTNDGFHMIVDPVDFLGSHVAVWREYEGGLRNIIRRFLRPGDHFVDVGANIGYFSLLAAKQVGPGGRVSSFEPSPIIREKFLRNVLVNSTSGVIHVFEKAAWKEEAELIFYEGPLDHCGVSSLRNFPNSSFKFPVPASPVDHLVPYKEFPVRVVKIDVEGAEYEALLGMRKIIETCQPYLAIEISGNFLKEFGHTADKVMTLLMNEFGYFPFIYDHLGKTESVDSTFFQKDDNLQFNMLFSPTPKF